MSDYKNGKIYKLVIADMVYIGSTAHPLSARFGWHMRDYTLWVNKGEHYTTACELFKMGLPVIELIELYPCDSRQELRDREGYHQLANPDCVNKKIAGRTYIEYREANRAQIIENQKAYYQANRTQLLENKKAYCIANRAQILENQKAYYQANRTQLLENQKIYRASVLRKKRLTAFIEKHILLTRE